MSYLASAVCVASKCAFSIATAALVSCWIWAMNIVTDTTINPKTTAVTIDQITIFRRVIGLSPVVSYDR
jgi:hypothetical protein